MHYQFFNKIFWTSLDIWELSKSENFYYLQRLKDSLQIYTKNDAILNILTLAWAELEVEDGHNTGHHGNFDDDETSTHHENSRLQRAC